MANLRLAALVKAAKEAREKGSTLAEAIEEKKESQGVTGMHGEAVTYNKEQQEFVRILASGQSCVLVGAAGTGKTTCTQGGIRATIETGIIPVLQAGDHKHLTSGTPGIIIVAYTRRATNNIKKVAPPDLYSNCITAHKSIEFAPIYYDIYDEASGEYKKTMKFEPTRNAINPLPTSIHTVIIEEASMLGTDLFEQMQAALQHKVQWVFIGDIQQLPPVFGPAILGFAMLALPVIELTHVYRQALESPIIRLAHRVLSGKPIPAEEYPEWSDSEHLTIHPWKKKITGEDATRVLASFFTKAIDSGVYDPEEDMILSPYNKACGTIELNKYIANHIARRKGAVTYEVIGGFNKHYLSIGDKVLYDKEDAEILEISPNPSYSGARYQAASIHLDYWGTNQDPSASSIPLEYTDDIDFLLDQAAAATDVEDRVTQASHKVRISLLDSGREITLTKAADVNSLLHAYALTVHKAQGSEWRKVFLAFHASHAVMMARELLYTAITRAREELYIICEPETFTKGILRQRIKGNTLEAKAEHFKGKVDSRTHNYVF